MRFLLLLYGDEAAETALGADGRRRMVEEHMAFSAELRASGALVAGEGLDASSATKTIRRRDRHVTDGPFIETREQIGGFYVVEAKDIDAAIEMAKRLPDSPGLIVEVRPIPEI